MCFPSVIGRSSTMKFAVVVLAVLAVASPLCAYKVPAVGSGALAKEIQDFVDLLPLGKMIALAKEYATKDKEFSVALKTLQSAEAKLYIKDLEAAPQAKKLLNYIQNAGLDIKKIVNAINKAFHLAPIASLEIEELEVGAGIAGFAADAGKLIPSNAYVAMYEDKMANSKVFSDFIHEVLKSENLEFLSKAHSNAHYLKLVAEAKQAGINSVTFKAGSPYIFAAKVILSRH